MSYINPQLYAYNDYTAIVTPYYPAIPANITQVTMQFALIGAGGSATSTGTGGGGGVFIGSVTLPTNIQNAGGYYGTPIYISVGKGGDQAASSTYISLQSYFTNHLLITPAYGEPYSLNGANATPLYGSGGNFSSNQLQLLDITGNKYSITHLYARNGTEGAQGGLGTPPGAPAWQINSEWVFITYPNTPTGQLAPSGFGGATTNDPFGNPVYGTGDRGMVIVQYNYTGFNYILYPSLPPLNYVYPFFYTQSSQSITVPYMSPLDVNGNVAVTFLFQGAGGNGDETPTLLCPYYDTNGDMLPGNTYFTGGSGGVIKGTVSLPPGTVLYINVSTNSAGNNSFISLTPSNGSAPPAGINGQLYASPFAMSGGSATIIYLISGTNGSGGGVYTGTSGVPITLQNTTTAYPVTITNFSNGVTGVNDCTGPEAGANPTLAVWITPPNYVGYLNNQLTTSTLVTTTGQGGEGVANNTWPQGYGTDGVVVVAFNMDIPWSTNDSGEERDPVPCFPEGTRILTPLGYKPVETIENGYLVTTSNHKQVSVKVYKRTVHSADRSTAPYRIPKYCLGSFPTADLRLSPHHAFRLQSDLWQIPEYAARQNKQIRQYGIGKSVTYYHLECPNYFRDHLLVDGCVVESYGKNQVDPTVPTYVYDSGRKGFVRTAKAKNAVHQRFSQ